MSQDHTDVRILMESNVSSSADSQEEDASDSNPGDDSVMLSELTVLVEDLLDTAEWLNAPRENGNP